jgi:16S rRNA (cytosine967-C5)-methyltransferase
LPSKPISPARSVAFRILRDVDRGAFASDLLYTLTQRLDSRDAALTTELVLGCLRRRSQLDYLLLHFSGRDPAKLSQRVRLALHLGIYQLRYLDRIPAHAAVSESVELSRRSGAPAAAGLVNAVLRKVNRDRVEWPDRATELGMPRWLLVRWESAYGAETALRIAQACLVPPETYLRVPPGREAEALALGAEPTGVAGCFRLLGDKPGPFRIQDIGSQCVVPLLDLQPGIRVLDLCAGAGGKTAQALETDVELVAADLDFDRLRSAPGDRVRLDGTRELPFSARFDRILIDAPCSGTGTLRRNPEIRWRLQNRELFEYQERQVSLVRNALQHLAPGGKLVYATCSLEREENEWVIESVRKQHPGVEVAAEMRRIPGVQPGDGFYAAVLRSQ